MLSVLAIVSLLGWAMGFVCRTPVVGAPDHGDYYRVGTPAGIVVQPPPRSPSGFPLLLRTFDVRAADLGRGATSAAVLAVVAKHLPAFGDPSSFDVRRLGALHVGLAALVVATAAMSGVPLGACAALTWAFVDPSYLAYANSLYSEPPALLATLGLALWFSSRLEARPPTRRRGWARFGALLGLLVLGAFSRAAMALVPCLVVFVLIARWRVRGPSLGRGGVVLSGALALAATLPALHFTVGSGPRFGEANAYDSVFMGLVLESPDRSATLEHLGLPADGVRYAGHPFFGENPPRKLRRQVAKISYLRRALVYAMEPRTTLRAASHAARLLAVGVRETGSEIPEVPARADPFWRFSRLRVLLFGWWPPLVWVALFATAAVLLGGARPTLPVAAFGFLGAMVITQTAIAVLGDGFYGIGRHLLVARFAFDGALALGFLEAARHGARVLGRLRAGSVTSAGQTR